MLLCVCWRLTRQLMYPSLCPAPSSTTLLLSISILAVLSRRKPREMNKRALHSETNCSLLQFFLWDNISKIFLQRASARPRVMSLTRLGLWSFPVRNFQNPIADLLLCFRLCIWNIILQPKWQFLYSKKKEWLSIKFPYRFLCLKL